MILRFPYQSEPLLGPPPPSMPHTAKERWRPLVPVTVFGPLGKAFFHRALLDSGADDTLFPLSFANLIGVPLLVDAGYGMKWRGQQYSLRFGLVELELKDPAGNSLRWPATVAFSAANIRYPLLGISGCLEFMDARFLGKDRIVELEPNADFS